MNAPAIKARGLRRRFGTIQALDGLDFEVPAGSVTGLLGPNGAGKSTTIQILLGLLRRHAGELAVLGRDPACQDVEIRRRTGFVPEDPHGEPRFSVRQNLDFLRSFRPTWDPELERSLLERLDLDPTKPSRNLSRGQRAKLALVGALSFRPELLILDDPTSGLDPLARREFIEGIVEVLAQEGRTVFFSSHQVDDIERVADRIVMISRGRCLYAEETDVIRSRWRCLRLACTDRPVPARLDLPGLRRWEPEGRAGKALFDGFAPETDRALAELGVEREEIPLNLEDVFVDLARHDRGETRP